MTELPTQISFLIGNISGFIKKHKEIFLVCCLPALILSLDLTNKKKKNGGRENKINLKFSSLWFKREKKNCVESHKGISLHFVRKKNGREE